MILPYLSQLNNLRILLASASPRRAEIMRCVGIPFDVHPSNFSEDLSKQGRTPHDYVTETAVHKACAVAREVPSADLVVGADTVVVRDGVILEKPVDAHDAREMLRSLSGRSHEVFTGVAIVFRHSHGEEKEGKESFKIVQFVERTEVTFASLPAALIDAYVLSGEPMDKAGAYGIQGLAGTFASGIHGCYFNVVGFPLHRFCVEVARLCEAGVFQATSQ